MTSKTIRSMSVKLDSDTRTRIAKLAAVRRRSTHWIMRDAIQLSVYSNTLNAKKSVKHSAKTHSRLGKNFRLPVCTRPLKKLTHGLPAGVLMVNCKHPNATSKICAWGDARSAMATRVSEALESCLAKRASERIRILLSPIPNDKN